MSEDLKDVFVLYREYYDCATEIYGVFRTEEAALAAEKDNSIHPSWGWLKIVKKELDVCSPT